MYLKQRIVTKKKLILFVHSFLHDFSTLYFLRGFNSITYIHSGVVYRTRKKYGKNVMLHYNTGGYENISHTKCHAYRLANPHWLGRLWENMFTVWEGTRFMYIIILIIKNKTTVFAVFYYY